MCAAISANLNQTTIDVSETNGEFCYKMEAGKSLSALAMGIANDIGRPGDWRAICTHLAQVNFGINDPFDASDTEGQRILRNIGTNQEIRLGAYQEHGKSIFFGIDPPTAVVLQEVTGDPHAVGGEATAAGAVRFQATAPGTSGAPSEPGAIRFPTNHHFVDTSANVDDAGVATEVVNIPPGTVEITPDGTVSIFNPEAAEGEGVFEISAEKQDEINRALREVLEFIPYLKDPGVLTADPTGFKAFTYDMFLEEDPNPDDRPLSEGPYNPFYVCREAEEALETLQGVLDAVVYEKMSSIIEFDDVQDDYMPDHPHYRQWKDQYLAESNPTQAAIMRIALAAEKLVTNNPDGPPATLPSTLPPEFPDDPAEALAYAHRVLGRAEEMLPYNDISDESVLAVLREETTVEAAVRTEYPYIQAQDYALRFARLVLDNEDITDEQIAELFTPGTEFHDAVITEYGEEAAEGLVLFYDAIVTAQGEGAAQSLVVDLAHQIQDQNVISDDQIFGLFSFGLFSSDTTFFETLAATYGEEQTVSHVLSLSRQILDHDDITDAEILELFQADTTFYDAVVATADKIAAEGEGAVAEGAGEIEAQGLVLDLAHRILDHEGITDDQIATLFAANTELYETVAAAYVPYATAEADRIGAPYTVQEELEIAEYERLGEDLYADQCLQKAEAELRSYNTGLSRLDDATSEALSLAKETEDWDTVYAIYEEASLPQHRPEFSADQRAELEVAISEGDGARVTAIYKEAGMVDYEPVRLSEDARALIRARTEHRNMIAGLRPEDADTFGFDLPEPDMRTGRVESGPTAVFADYIKSSMGELQDTYYAFNTDLAREIDYVQRADRANIGAEYDALAAAAMEEAEGEEFDAQADFEAHAEDDAFSEDFDELSEAELADEVADSSTERVLGRADEEDVEITIRDLDAEVDAEVATAPTPTEPDAVVGAIDEPGDAVATAATSTKAEPVIEPEQEAGGALARGARPDVLPPVHEAEHEQDATAVAAAGSKAVASDEAEEAPPEEAAEPVVASFSFGAPDATPDERTRLRRAALESADLNPDSAFYARSSDQEIADIVATTRGTPSFQHKMTRKRIMLEDLGLDPETYMERPFHEIAYALYSQGNEEEAARVCVLGGVFPSQFEERYSDVDADSFKLLYREAKYGDKITLYLERHPEAEALGDSHLRRLVGKENDAIEVYLQENPTYAERVPETGEYRYDRADLLRFIQEDNPELYATTLIQSDD